MISLWQISTSLKTYKQDWLRLSYSLLFLSFSLLLLGKPLAAVYNFHSLQFGRWEEPIWTQEDHFHNSSEVLRPVTAMAAEKDCQEEDQNSAFFYEGVIELWYTDCRRSVHFPVFFLTASFSLPLHCSMMRHWQGHFHGTAPILAGYREKPKGSRGAKGPC